MKKKIRQPELPLMHRIALDAGGMDAALGLARALGGQKVYIPLKLGNNQLHALISAAGRKAADAITREFGGDWHVVPTMHALRRPLAIALLAEDKLSANEISKLTGLHYTHVKRLRSHLRFGLIGADIPLPRMKRRAADPRQMDLEDIIKGPHPSR